MNQSRLLPGGPSSSERSTVGPRVLSLLPRLDLTNLDPNSSQLASFKKKSRTTIAYNMPSTPTLSDIWEHTLTNIFRYDSKSETGKLLRSWDKHHKLEQFYQLLSWDIEEFTSHGALNSYMEKPNCENPSHLHPQTDVQAKTIC